MWRYCGHLTLGLGLFGLASGLASVFLYQAQIQSRQPANAKLNQLHVSRM